MSEAEKGSKIESLGRELQESLKKILRDYAEALFFAILLALILRSFVLSSYKIHNDFLAPDLRSGDFILGFRFPYGVSLPFLGQQWGRVSAGLGDYAIYACEADGKRASCIRRVIGLPGDRIELRQGRVLRNQKVVFDYGKSDLTTEPVIVPPESVFLVSNSLEDSMDSFKRGPLPWGSLRARAEWIWFSYEPEDGIRWNRIGRISDNFFQK